MKKFIVCSDRGLNYDLMQIAALSYSCVLQIRLVKPLTNIKDTYTGDDTEKLWAHWFLTKPKTFVAGGLGGVVSPQWGQGDALVKTWVQHP